MRDMSTSHKSSRRSFLENTALGAIGVIGASQLIKSCSSEADNTGKVVLPEILYVAPDGQPLRAGVVGCGGRGSGAAVPNAPGTTPPRLISAAEPGENPGPLAPHPG